MDSFFGIGIPELILILIIAGVVMGPERIGVVARWLGRTTAQLQAISRSFVRQLNAELDGIQGTNEVREAVKDMQDLRDQIDQLKQEFISVTDSATRDSRRMISDSKKEIERIIAPPAIQNPTSNSADQTYTEFTEQELPKRLEVPDDPEP